ncbi:MAG: integrase core domain-containing protein [Mariprofundaceae bacterium]
MPQKCRERQNGHNESLNGVFRDGCLDRWKFYSIPEARRVINHWLEEYNHECPHGALSNITPAAFAENIETSREMRHDP